MMPWQPTRPPIQKKPTSWIWSQPATRHPQSGGGFYPTCVTSFGGQAPQKSSATVPWVRAIGPSWPHPVGANLQAGVQALPPAQEGPAGSAVASFKGLARWVETGEGQFLLRRSKPSGKQARVVRILLTVAAYGSGAAFEFCKG